jgi:hypothetical protein
VADAIQVIQATLAPSFLISGTSIFLNFTQTRLFRVVDRVRSIASGETADAPNSHLQTRLKMLRNAIAVGVFTVALTVMTAILVMASVMFDRESIGNAAPWVFAMAMVTLFVALLFVLYDTILSVRSVTGPSKPA